MFTELTKDTIVIDLFEAYRFEETEVLPIYTDTKPITQCGCLPMPNTVAFGDVID